MLNLVVVVYLITILIRIIPFQGYFIEITAIIEGVSALYLF